jgi:hypothetical protein
MDQRTEEEYAAAVAAGEPRVMNDGRRFYEWQLETLGRHVQKGMKIENLRWVAGRDQFAWDYC